MIEWIRECVAWFAGHKVLLWWLFSVSVVMFVGALVAVPWVLVKLPANYFVSDDRHSPKWLDRHAALRVTMLVLKNVLAWVLVLAGIAMLVLPGQGLLTIFVGIMLADFPGKYRLERWVVSWGPVLRSANWIRRRWHKPPLVIPDELVAEDGDGPRGG